MAEVLITLAVIGVVAALTIPTLIQSYKKSVTETKLAKFYSVMNNAIRMAEVEYGSQSTWTDYNIDDEVDKEGNTLYDKGDRNDFIVNKYFAPYIKIVGSDPDILHRRVYYLSDGSAFALALHENREIYFYPSDPKKCIPLVYGSCSFLFIFIPNNQGRTMFNELFKYNIGNGMQPDLYKWDGTADSLMNDASSGCKEGNGIFCTEIIRRNGWKIPKDYPRKL